MLSGVFGSRSLMDGFGRDGLQSLKASPEQTP